ncbi:hypothetical protein A3D78_05825 [Candidatus Gottesmanbacteria bacterium RIFCSPHIGHO2_02_FULL_39_14]|uniref:EamA domain-containing protein n=1 Tax=Candidatus Gottesmanbacteria bacterium RIFCSPHIGHO2_02_FULL_39_14 TaxID=1798383 RepID=A0A1F6A2Q2_9BACT|nr:MAG: hypothetical protein A3D78_05825 [Candidatus Gottesmanbacteria bacterium RIFCSPHIGHO2_02_FULL_39_14]
MNEKLNAILALLIATVFWSFSVIFNRSIVNEINPFTLLFLRLIIPAIIIFPFFIKKRIWTHTHFPELLKVSILFMLNMSLFSFGIKYTSASASHLLYSLAPILIILYGVYFKTEKYKFGRLLGVILGLIGILIIINLSRIEKESTLSGGFIGNVVIFVAVICSTAYLLWTKRLLKIFTAFDTTGISIIVSAIFSIPILIYGNLILKEPVILTSTNLYAVLFIGIFGTLINFYLYQYALSKLSALTTSIISYLQPIFTAILEILLLSGALTHGFVFGGSLVFLGVFLSTTYEFIKRRKQ